MEDGFRHVLDKHMNKSEFKKVFGKFAIDNGFESAFGGWFRESGDCIVAMQLQSSNYSSLFYLNIKVFLQGGFPNYYGEIKVCKDLVKKHVGDYFTRPPANYDRLFDLENSISDAERELLVEQFFTIYLRDFVESLLSRSGLMTLAKEGAINLTDPVQKEIGRLDRLHRSSL